MSRALHLACRGCLSAFLLVATACHFGRVEVDGYRCDDFVRASLYDGRRLEDSLREIRTYPTDKQYAVFICGSQHMHPPDWETAGPFVAHGALAAEFLVRKLPTIDDDRTIEDIVMLVEDMDRAGTYKTIRGSELARALEKSVSRIKDDRRKDAEDRLRRIIKE